MHRLPDNTETESGEEYVEAWQVLARPIKEYFGFESMAFDPDYQFYNPDKQASVDMPVWLVKMLNQVIKAAAAKTASKEAIEALIYYGELHTVEGVKLPSGSHKEWIDRTRKMIYNEDFNKESDNAT